MSDERSTVDESSIRRRQTVRVVAIGILVVIAAALAIDNRQSVTLSYVVGDGNAPLVVALVVAFVFGLVVGGLLVSRRARS